MTALLLPDPAAAISRGLVVFPLPPGGRVPAPGWQHQHLRTRDELRRWPAGANIGVGCRANRLVVLDLDRDPDVDGAASFAAVCERLGEPWPDTLTVATPHDGSHLYFRAPAGRVILSSSGGRAGLGPGVDVRAPGRRSGGYVVGPGSVVDGRAYTITHDTAVAELPDWLAALLAASVPVAAGRRP